MYDKHKLLQLVKEGQIIKCAVVSFGKTRDPVVKVNNYAIFIKKRYSKNIKVGMILPIKITKIFPNFGFADELEK